MPLYEYECPRCGQITEELMAAGGPRRIKCKCGGTSKRIPSLCMMNTFDPFYDIRLGRYFTSREERVAHMKKHLIVENRFAVSGGEHQRNRPLKLNRKGRLIIKGSGKRKENDHGLRPTSA